MPSTHPCPDLEELAAFVDGRLPADRRAALVEHLGSCEDCYELYADTLRVTEELADEPTASGDDLEIREDETPDDDALAPVVMHPSAWRRVGPAALATAALAAAAAVVLLVPGYLSLATPSADLITVAGIGPGTSLASDPASERPADAWHVHRWSVTRGTNPYERLTPEERSFRVGVRVVDLASALAIDDRDVAGKIVAEIVLLLEAEELSFQEMLYESLRGDFGSGAPASRLLERSARAERDLSPEDELYFELGKWTEAARLAARTGQARYFETRAFRGFLRRAPREELSAGVVAKLDEIEGLARADADVETLENALEGLITLRSLSR